jgi:hypothetical protein
MPCMKHFDIGETNNKHAKFSNFIVTNKIVKGLNFFQLLNLLEKK